MFQILALIPCIISPLYLDAMYFEQLALIIQLHPPSLTNQSDNLLSRKRFYPELLKRAVDRTGVQMQEASVLCAPEHLVSIANLL